MSQVIRIDEDHFAYVHPDIRHEMAKEMMEMFKKAWPGKELLCFRADEFIDLTGQYQIVRLDPEA